MKAKFTRIKPCPLCGWQPKIDIDYEIGYPQKTYFCWCDKGCRLGLDIYDMPLEFLGYNNRQDAINAWNKITVVTAV